MSDPTPSALAIARIATLPAHDEHYNESEDYPSMVRDILTDLRHFCQRYGVDFYAATHGSYQVYFEESRLDD